MDREHRLKKSPIYVFYADTESGYLPITQKGFDENKTLGICFNPEYFYDKYNHRIHTKIMFYGVRKNVSNFGQYVQIHLDHIKGDIQKYFAKHGMEGTIHYCRANSKSCPFGVSAVDIERYRNKSADRLMHLNIYVK